MRRERAGGAAGGCLTGLQQVAQRVQAGKAGDLTHALLAAAEKSPGCQGPALGARPAGTFDMFRKAGGVQSQLGRGPWHMDVDMHARQLV